MTWCRRLLESAARVRDRRFLARDLLPCGLGDLIRAASAHGRLAVGNDFLTAMQAEFLGSPVNVPTDAIGDVHRLVLREFDDSGSAKIEIAIVGREHWVSLNGLGQLLGSCTPPGTSE